MLRRLAMVVLMALVLTGLAGARDVKLEGVVQGLDFGTRTLTLNGPQGWQRIWVQNSTDVESRGSRVDWTSLRQGDRVVVEGVPLDDGRILASRIRVSGSGGGSGNPGTGGASGLTPAPGSRITSTRPTISASFGENLNRARLWVDGADFSSQLQVSGGVVSWTPNYNLDYGQHTVRIEASSLFGASYPANWSFEIAPSAVDVQVTNYAPGPGTVVTVLQPTISADFSGPVSTRTVRMYVDGRDFTPQIQVYGNRVSWTPRFTLDYGQHTVRVEALTATRQRVEGTWNFVISR